MFTVQGSWFYRGNWCCLNIRCLRTLLDNRRNEFFNGIRKKDAHSQSMKMTIDGSAHVNGHDEFPEEILGESWDRRMGQGTRPVPGRWSYLPSAGLVSSTYGILHADSFHGYFRFLYIAFRWNPTFLVAILTCFIRGFFSGVQYVAKKSLGPDIKDYERPLSKLPFFKSP